MFERTIVTDHEYFSLPENAESVLSAVVDNLPSEMRASGKTTRPLAFIRGVQCPVYGIVDDGLHPTIIDLNESSLYQIKVVPITPRTALPSEGSVFVTYERADGSKKVHEFVLDGSASMITTEPHATKKQFLY